MNNLLRSARQSIDKAKSVLHATADIKSEVLGRAVLAGHIYDDRLGLWRVKHTFEYDYSDGTAVEQDLNNILVGCNDVSLYSRELLNHQKGWVKSYYFSPDRANLIRPFERSLVGADVLELGCGCGAVTRYLGEVGAQVYAVEGSLNRAKIAAERCRDLSNVSVICDKIESLPFERQFDVVTLVGVLEYSRKYVDAVDPVRHVLEKARSYLKEGGLLFVAIENQLGLKYFAGAPEDHGVGVMAGINDAYRADSPVTFGRKELEGLFLKAGFAGVETHLPFPDYKLPSVVVHPKGYGYDLPWNLADLINTTLHTDRQAVPFPLFSLKAAWPVVVRNKLTADMAHSHLFIARNGETFPSVDSDTLASYYSPSRSKENAQEVRFLQYGSQVQVSRRRLYGDCEPVVEPYRQGTLHEQTLHRIIQRPGWGLDEVSAWAKVWTEALAQYLITPSIVPVGWERYTQWLPESYIDAIPRNLILGDETSYFIDLEWQADHPLPIELIIYRGLFVTFSCVQSVAKPKDSRLITAHVLIEEVMVALGYHLDVNDYALFMPVIDGLARRAKGLEPNLVPPLAPRTEQQLQVRDFESSKPVRYQITLYYREKGGMFSEEDTVKHLAAFSNKLQSINLRISPTGGRLDALRLDIADRPGVFVIEGLTVETDSGALLWAWSGLASDLMGVAEVDVFSEGTGTRRAVIQSHGRDPRFILPLGEGVLSALSERGGVVVLKLHSYS